MKDKTCLRTTIARKTPLARATTGFRRSARVAVIAAFAGFLSAASPALASHQIPLNSAEPFAVLGASAVTNTGGTIVTGDLGISGASPVTGFPPGVLNGNLYDIAHPNAVAANAALGVAYLAAEGAVCGTPLTGFDLGTLPTLVPGVYCFTSGAPLTGTLVLDAQNDPDAQFIFQIASTLVTATNSSVVVINPSATFQVVWQVGSSATLGTGTAFVGNILAKTSITLTTGASLSGRALARDGAVTMDTNAVSCGSCDGNNEIPGVNPPAGALKVTGGGQIWVPKPYPSLPDPTATGTGQANFGFNAQMSISGVVKGSFNYDNKVTRLHIQGKVDDIVVIATNPNGSAKTVRLSGTCNAKLPMCAFSITAEDNGKGGTTDEFGITVTGAMVENLSQRVLRSGNITLR
jgi:hypothetical protein